MTTNANGFLSIEQLDRVNLKTLAQGGLPEPYGQGDLFGLFKALQVGYEAGGLNSHEALDAAVSWYCIHTNEEVVAMLKSYEDNELFQATRYVVNAMHENPERFQQAIDAVNNGWTPDNNDN